jgi:hypothetical protein
MKATVLCAAIFGFSTPVHAAVPAGPDAVNGAFVRMLDHRAAGASTGAAASKARDFQFDRTFNAAVRGSATNREARASNMLAADVKGASRSCACVEPVP